MFRAVVMLVASITAACGSTDNDGAGGTGSSGAGGAGAAGGTAGGSGGSAAAPDCGARCGAPGCPACRGPSMIDSTPQTFEAYRIDSTEVTNAHYAEFLAANPEPASQPAECAWNAAFAPEIGEPKGACSSELYDPRGSRQSSCRVRRLVRCARVLRVGGQADLRGAAGSTDR